MSVINDLKDWLISNQKNIFLLIGILVLGAISFESGFLKGKISQSAPLVISIPAIPDPALVSTNSENPSTEAVVIPEKQTGASCSLVGSRNSNKYHLITCAVAKRIKPENKVCFASKEDAEKRGYVAGCVK